MDDPSACCYPLSVPQLCDADMSTTSVTGSMNPPHRLATSPGTSVLALSCPKSGPSSPTSTLPVPSGLHHYRLPSSPSTPDIFHQLVVSLSISPSTLTFFQKQKLGFWEIHLGYAHCKTSELLIMTTPPLTTVLPPSPASPLQSRRRPAKFLPQVLPRRRPSRTLRHILVVFFLISPLTLTFFQKQKLGSWEYIWITTRNRS